jgi:hypothetical protein
VPQLAASSLQPVATSSLHQSPLPRPFQCNIIVAIGNLQLSSISMRRT